MNIFNKFRWRLEKNIIDPIIRSYLKNRIYEKNSSPNLAFVVEPVLSKFSANKYFQCMITSSSMENIYEDLFDKAYERGIKNDPNNNKEKEYLRYRIYINTIIAKLATKGGGDFCTVGISWGIVPRTIYQYLKNFKFWDENRQYFLIDKWEKVLFASESNIIQPMYCGDFDFIKNEFRENNFQIIREYAPQAFDEITNKFSYIHLNTGDRVSEYKTVKALYPQLTSPGFIVIDNYYYSNNEESIDGFLKKQDNFVIPIGNSQGVVIKA